MVTKDSDFPKMRIQVTPLGKPPRPTGICEGKGHLECSVGRSRRILSKTLWPTAVLTKCRSSHYLSFQNLCILVCWVMCSQNSIRDVDSHTIRVNSKKSRESFIHLSLKEWSALKLQESSTALNPKKNPSWAVLKQWEYRDTTIWLFLF